MIDQIEPHFSSLSSPQRVAVSIACAERAADLYTETAESELSIFRDAIQIAWQMLAKPTAANRIKIQKIREQFVDLAPDSEEGDNVLLCVCSSVDAALATLETPNGFHAAMSLLDAIENAAMNDQDADSAIERELVCIENLCRKASSSNAPDRQYLSDLISVPVSWSEDEHDTQPPDYDPRARVFAKDERAELCVGEKTSGRIKRPVAVGPSLHAIRNYAANYMISQLADDEILIAIDAYAIAEIGVMIDGEILWSKP